MCARSQGAESGTFVICLPAESAENENDKELLCCKLHESAKGWMETLISREDLILLPREEEDCGSRPLKGRIGVPKVLKAARV